MADLSSDLLWSFKAGGDLQAQTGRCTGTNGEAHSWKEMKPKETNSFG